MTHNDDHPEQSGGTVLCDYPGCPQPATGIAQAQGANTPPKQWYHCTEHAPHSGRDAGA